MLSPPMPVGPPPDAIDGKPPMPPIPGMPPKPPMPGNPNPPGAAPAPGAPVDAPVVPLVDAPVVAPPAGAAVLLGAGAGFFLGGLLTKCTVWPSSSLISSTVYSSFKIQPLNTSVNQLASRSVFYCVQSSFICSIVVLALTSISNVSPAPDILILTLNDIVICSL